MTTCMQTNWITLDEMDKFRETQSLPTLWKEEIENLNRPITSKEIESIFKNQLNIEKPCTWWLHWWILPNILRRINTNTPQTLPNNWRGGNTSSSFYKASIALIPKPDKDTTWKERLQISLMNIDEKNPQQNTSKLSSTIF